MDRRSVLRLMASAGLAGAAAPVLSACGGSSPAAQGGRPVRIGVVVPQSGGYKSIGDDLGNGFELYLNLNGRRLGGRTVQLFYADEGETEASGKAAVNKLLVGDQVAVLTGIASSVTMLAVKDTVEKAQIPLLGSNASPTTLQGVKYIWRTSYVNDEPGRALGGYLARQVTGPLYLIAADYAAGHDEITGFLDTFQEAGGKVITPVYVSQQTADFSQYLTAIRYSGAKAVFAFFAGAQAAKFVTDYHNAGLNKPLYAPGFLTEGAPVLKAEGDAASGIYTSLNYSPDLDNAANRTFATAYEKAYDSLPTTYAMASYDAAAVLDKALVLTGNDRSPQALNAAIAHVGEIDSPRGPWQFNQSRTPQQKWYLRQVVRDGTVLSNLVVSELVTLG